MVIVRHVLTETRMYVGSRTCWRQSVDARLHT
jgi:hypothetical protein